MGSVIFDFDSTLVRCESLEVLCRRGTPLDRPVEAEIERITNAGMDGSMPFEESLRRRLALAPPSRPHVAALGDELAAAPTDGAAALITSLHERGHEAWIVSGGIRDLLLIVARVLGIPDERTWGVGTVWSPDGSLEALVDDGFSRSKLEGVRRGGMVFERPAVGVGDGATDLALREGGVVDHFVAYTEHVRRESVVARADHEARTMHDLATVLEGLLS